MREREAETIPQVAVELGRWKPQVQVPVCIRQKESHCRASISFHMSASSTAILRIALFLGFTPRKMFRSLLFFSSMETNINQNFQISHFFFPPQLEFSFFNQLYNHMFHFIFYCQSYTCHKQSLQLQNELFIWREWIPERCKFPAWILLCFSFVTHFIPYLALVRLRAKAPSSCPNRIICSSPFLSRAQRK